MEVTHQHVYSRTKHSARTAKLAGLVLVSISSCSTVFAEGAEDEYAAGLVAQKGGNPAEAIIHYRKAASFKPDESAYVEAVATFHQQLKDYENALNSYDQAIAIATKNQRKSDVDIYKKQRQDCAEERAGPIVDKAIEAFKSSDFARAADLYGQVLQIVPNVARMHTSRATALQNADNFAAALEEFQKGYGLDPKGEKENLYFIAALQEHFGKGAQALAIYRKYLNGQYTILAEARVKQLSGDLTKTVKFSTTGDRKAQESITKFYSDAVAAYNKADYPASVARMKDLFQVPGTDNEPDYHYYIGLGYMGVKDFDSAKSEFSKAVKLAPNNRNFKDALDSVAQMKVAPFVDQAVKAHTAGNFAKAIALYKDAIELAPDSASLYTSLGTALFAALRYPEAEAAFNKSSELDRESKPMNDAFIEQMKPQGPFERNRVNVRRDLDGLDSVPVEYRNKRN